MKNNDFVLTVAPDSDDTFKIIDGNYLQEAINKYKIMYNAKLYVWAKYPLLSIISNNIGCIIARDVDEVKSILPKMLGKIFSYDGFGEPPSIILSCYQDNYKEFIFDTSDPYNKNKESNNSPEDEDKLFAWSIYNPHFNCKYTQARKRGIVTGVIWAKNMQDAKDKILAKFSSSNYDVDGLIYTEDINLMEFEEITEEFQIIGDYEE